MELEKEKDEEEKKPAMKTEEEIGNDDESDTEQVSENDIKEEDQEEEEEVEEEEILPPPVVELKELHSNPDFAVVCSFFNKFSLMGNLRHLSFGKLETLFTTYENNKVPRELIDLHVFLLRRIKYQHATVDNWEKYLRKCLASDPTTVEELTRIERYGGYAYISIADKIRILKALCELQIELNAKFREAIMQTCRNIDFRLIPVGTDRYGLSYWYQQDNECTMRLYTEEADDHCGSTWTLAAKTHDELKTLIENLEKDDLGYDKSLDPLEKQKLTDIQKGKIPVGHTDKKGTYLDTYIDQSSVQKLKDEVLKKKTERNNRKTGTHTKVRKFVEEEPEEEEVEEEKPKVEDDQEDKEDEVEIPEELLEGRRPRRGASIKAASNLKKVLGVGTTPKRTPKKTTEKKASVEPSDHEDEEDEDDNEDEDEEVSEDEQEDSGDEFRPKSEKKKSKKKRVKKRKATPSDDEDDESVEDEEIVVKERKVATGDAACGKCKTSKDWEVLLLCDCCDDAWHTYCLKPVLWFVPDGDWYCPKCKHGRLINRLKVVEERLNVDLDLKAIEDKKKQAAAERLRREMEHIGVNLNNIIQTHQVLLQPQKQSSSSESEDDGTQRKSKKKAVKKMSNWNKPKPQNNVPVYVGGRRSCRNTNKVDYKGSEFDQMINEAVENIDGAPLKEVKPPKEPELDENGVPIPKAPRGKKRAKLNDLDAVVDSDGSNNYEEEQEETPSEEEEEAEIDSGSDFEDELPKTSKHRSRRSKTGGRRNGGGGGKGRGRRNRSWSGSSTEEEEDDWIASDSDDGYSNKRKRKIRYESEPEEEEEDVEKSTTGRPLRRAVKSSDKKIVISDDDSDAENCGPVPKKKSKKGTSDDEFEVENDNEGEEDDEEEEEMDEDNDEEEDEEDDDSDKDSNDSEPRGEIKRMAGAPPSQQLPVRPVRPQISAKRPRIKPDSKKEKTPESDENDDEEDVPTKKPDVALQNSLWTPGNLPENFQPMIANPYLRPAETTSPSKIASNTAEQNALPVSNPYANVSQKKDDLQTKPSGAANYLAL
ncbi:unnamed protein product [Caenorhabditis angaria]|uniref:PHD-type domain-containing protein n=1 Tax=Caenorhabditis angaria TaxID=860376 RepID=A0A9P1J3B2_9PELO|nr:unnamed protein product [Caenorhabditis angaria]